MKTLADYVKWAKENPDHANYGHAALGAPPHFLGLVFADAIGVNLSAVPYQGGGPMVTDLLGGQVSAIVNPLGGQIIELHRSGKARVLALSSPERFSQLPDVPTFAELGYPAMTVVSTNVLYAPPATPAGTVSDWNKVVHKVLINAEVKEQFATMGFTAIPGTPEDVKAKTAADLKYWTPVVKAIGFQGN